MRKVAPVRGSRPAPVPADFEQAANLRAALRAFLRGSERVTRKHGLTNERYELLLLIKRAEELGEKTTVSDLALALDLAKSSITQLVRRAEDLRLVRRELSDHDARIRYLRVTPEGERRLGAAVAELDQDRGRLLELLSKSDTEAQERAG